MSINNLILRGCFIRNTEYVIGGIVYVGPETKIMKNTRKPPRKVTEVGKHMNYMLYLVFFIQLIIILIFATLSILW